jgi:NADPH-dependent glutamate synthase beta subunit-like oxidoreductase
VRTRRPVYLDLLPPCNGGCPAGENIQAWLADIQAGRPEQAWRQLVADNPLPAIHGRVCYHPCETVCNRAQLDSSVSIHGVERYLGDLALDEGWAFDPPPPSTGQRVLVIGAGPSGLSAAYNLARLGHQVEIRDASPEPGGMMRYGIPAYRLPRDVIAGEIARITALGVAITCGHRVENLDAERRDGSFDAVFVAVGAHLSKHVDIPARDATRIVDAVSFLREVASGGRPVIGRRVAVYGGGNTAMDAARVARRLGADDALIVYRRTRDQMPAHEEEAQEAEREGVRINWLHTITAFEGPEMTVEVMELDDSGFPQPTGKLETLAADTLILAVGQDADTTFLRQVPGVEFKRDGTVVVSPSMMTGSPGVFAGGDMVPAERTVTVGTGHGRKAARFIDAYLRSQEALIPAKHATAGFGLLHPWYLTDAGQRRQPEREPAGRVTDFAEVVGGLSAEQATYEAGRCLSCGNCIECDGCLGACPEDAIIKLGPSRPVGHAHDTPFIYRFDYDRCTGCATCYDQCPVHAIEMIQE